MKLPRRKIQAGRTCRLVARGTVALGALTLVACGRGKLDLCAGAVRHVFELV